MGTNMLGGQARRPLTTRLLAVAAASAAIAVMTPGAAYASVVTTPESGVAKVGSGGVHAFAVDSMGRTYIAGLFSTVGGEPRTNVAAIGADGRVVQDFDPATNGKVLAVAVSADGTTVFLGGNFTQVDGHPRRGLAALDAASGEVLTDWVADAAGTSFDVASLAVKGSRLYVGGRFTNLDGLEKPAPRLAAVDVTTGQADATFRPRPNLGVREVVVTPNGSTVYLGGAFTKVQGLPREAAAAVDAVTGKPTSFAPTAQGGNAVTIDLSPDGSRAFYSTENNMLFAYDAVAPNSMVWQIKTSGNTQAIEVIGDEMWIGGHFSQTVSPEKIARPFLASLDPADGSVNAWDTMCTGGKQGVWELYHDTERLHAGGYFAAFHGVKQRGYARFANVP